MMTVGVVDLFHIGEKLPQSGVLGHFFGFGFLSGLQSWVLQVTVPGVPDAPAATPHLVAHPLGAPCTQSPKLWM